jgi:hypothetical protein
MQSLGFGDQSGLMQAPAAATPKDPFPEPPKFEPPGPDPALAFLADQTKRQQIAGIQDRVTADTARLMMMYGTRFALAGGGVSPLA